MGAEGRSHIPRHGGAHRTQHKTNDAACQSVLHGPIGCEPGREVAARDPEDREIAKKKEEEIREKMMDKTLADSYPASDPPSSIPDPGEDDSMAA